jgi:S-adenosylmethionine:tRNA ribosyltransferase-isomerase
MSAKDIRIEDYRYDLPDERIARYPLAERDQSKLLVFREGVIQSDQYLNLAEHLQAGALILFNNTRVIPARLLFEKPTGGVVEIFCLEPEAELATAMLQKKETIWRCLVGGINKWKKGPVYLTRQYESGTIQLQAELLGKVDNNFRIHFQWTPSELTFSEAIELAGQVPLPPYLDRAAEYEDRERYQTIYAQFDGSVAAPTAGLHFTQGIFDALRLKDITPAYLTLHVGAGTFKPVKTEAIGDHEMHAEYFDVSIPTLRALLEPNRQVIAVGTTTLRTLESLFLMGSKLCRQTDLSLEELEIKQWDAFDPHHDNVTPAQAFSALLKCLENNEKDRIIAKTQLMIAPGYTIRTVDALATNFHQPGSTLLLLVAALVGESWKNIYQYALDNDYRFLSYGDGALLFNTAKDHQR